jgi:MFS family permease
MKKLSASIMIPSVVLGFGAITIGQGFLKHWGELAACRILLGVIEGAFLPASLFLLQVWYTRFEYQKRVAAYYLVGIGSSGLSGLLAYGIEKMDGTAGIAGWRWIFIIVSIDQ